MTCNISGGPEIFLKRKVGLHLKKVENHLVNLFGGKIMMILSDAIFGILWST